ncbi:MAG TPA: hypothetical protein P5525_11890 [Candidatus Paceibacterota bacterium]|nr:hypothetical protein [Candidatus Paceibacterota bacterium]
MTVLPTRPRHAGRNLIWAEVKESFLMGIGALTTHKLRSSLTVLGVLVGVFSIIGASFGPICGSRSSW